MNKIELRTATDEFVAVVELPPFPPEAMPEVVLWGSRVFKLAGGPLNYREVFACVSLTPSPGLPRE
jgi:hypothetical protein